MLLFDKPTCWISFYFERVRRFLRPSCPLLSKCSWMLNHTLLTRPAVCLDPLPLSSSKLPGSHRWSQHDVPFCCCPLSWEILVACWNIIWRELSVLHETPCPTERRVINKAVDACPQPDVAAGGVVLTSVVSSWLIKFAKNPVELFFCHSFKIYILFGDFQIFLETSDSPRRWSGCTLFISWYFKFDWALHETLAQTSPLRGLVLLILLQPFIKTETTK